MLELPTGLHIKEEIPPYQEVMEDPEDLLKNENLGLLKNTSVEHKEKEILNIKNVKVDPEASFGSENSSTNSNIEQEGTGTFSVKSEINHIKESKVRIKEEIKSFEESKNSLGILHLPVVKIERNFELEQALKEELGREAQNGNMEKSTGKSNQTSSISDGDSFKNRTPKKQAGHLQHLSMAVCLFCNKCFRGKIDLKNHICIGSVEKKNIKKFGLEKSLDGGKVKKIKLENGCLGQNRFFRCEVCSAQFNNKRLLFCHYKSHLFASPSNKPFSCGKCGKPFVNKVQLNLHLIAHSEDKPFTCDHCGQSFKRKFGIKIHIQHVHCGGIKSYKCDECSKCFSHKATVSIHKRRAHSDLRPYSCNQCGDTFIDKKCLKIHFQIHSGLKPYPCSFCEKTFAQLPHKKRHELVHTGDKPYLCKTCGKSFRDSSNFKVHQVVHSGLRPFKCDKCSKSYTQSSHLKKHIRTAHSKARPFVCDVCEDSFKTKETLTAHVLLHSDVKPFNCEACGRSFVQATAFKRHKCKPCRDL